MSIPYIGVTDIVSTTQTRYFTPLFEGTEFRLMVGVMMSFKTLIGKATSWSGLWPTREELRYVFGPTPHTYNTLHYADYGNHTEERHLLRAVMYGGPHLHALQLDMVWPCSTMVRSFRRKRPDIEVVLQVGREAVALADGNPAEVVRRIQRYGESIDYVLFDMSGGEGKNMDAVGLLPFLRCVERDVPSVDLAVAGGLGPDTVHLLDPILKEFPHISQDAQGRLRPSMNSRDSLDPSLVREYIIQSLARRKRNL